MPNHLLVNIQFLCVQSSVKKPIAISHSFANEKSFLQPTALFPFDCEKQSFFQANGTKPQSIEKQIKLDFLSHMLLPLNVIVSGKQLRKLPRLTNSNIITIKRPETIRAKSNGRMGFAPLFEEERRQKMKMLKQVVKIMSDKKNNDRQTASSTTTTTTTTTPRPTTRRPTTTTLTTSTTTTKPTTTTTSKPIQKSAAELLGLPELPPEPAVTPSPIFQIRIESPKSFQTSELSSKDYDYSDDLDYQDNPGRWQIIPPVEASKAIARHRVDPEQPILSLAPPPPAPPSAPSSSSSSNSVQNRPVSPFQIVGHVMSDEELKSFPDSPIGKFKIPNL